MKRKRTFVVLVLFFSICSFFLTLNYYISDQGVLFPGIHIAGVEVSGLTQKEATELVSEQVSEKLSQELILKLDLTNKEAQSLKIKLADLGLSYSIANSVEEAWKQGREGNIIIKAFQKHKVARGYDVPLQVNWDQKALKDGLTQRLQSFRSPPENATVKVTVDHQIEIVPEKVGLEADISPLLRDITECDFLKDVSKSFQVNFKEIPPKITASSLKEEITGLLAEYSTSFHLYEVNRTQNIRLAVKALDQILLAPGEILSFNDTVGERTAEAGYKEAMIIINGKFVPGLGGGICQVSSNLYNAIRRAGLEVVERHAHTLPVSYVPPGMDATVAYPTLDFRFRNNTGSYLLINSLIDGNTLTFQLYGKI